MDSVNATILFENTKPDATGYIVDNGLSILVENDGNRILYDTGKNDGLLKNAEALGVDLSIVDAVVISHGHNDHTGGLMGFLQVNSNAPIYLKKDALTPLFVKTPKIEKNISTDTRVFLKYTSRFKFVDTITKIGEGIFIVPDIKRLYPIPSVNQILFSGRNGTTVNDKFEHELFMIIKENDHLVIFTGCGHTGVQNIITTAKEVCSGTKVKAVIGGFHYESPSIKDYKEPKKNIEATARWIFQEGIEKIYTGHCTGSRGYSIMKPILKNKINRITTGMKITI
jgi:7,8-dihydropterin-6-yl-methyl-4-(beta-D-ribofuranosyl)aminobenzene 5'-phosphate synthase